ncbi:beta-lactamase family protein [Streptomyces puniciscabiei]|uniref:Beta-lactamase family protein n=1 Tax=Streptomyces puniciscabiei TaxID=164348 RepID=A0A542UMG5_9ACTN|nr:serine hydrolase [Streptomyces puniciscabiei]TQL00281.1 beta-lactamase family protein [Streptomyces puniciscabiei]
MESSGARRGRRARRPRRRPLLSVALSVVAVGGVTAGGTEYVKARAHSGPAAVSSAATTSASPSAGAGEEASVGPGTEPAVDRTALLGKAMSAVSVPSGAQVSAAVLAVDSGESAAYGNAAFDTASIVKVDILATLLLQAQDADRRLTATEKAYATKMIENSDNASATALWHTVGRADGLNAANKRFGLTATSGGEGELWGLTQTTAADQLALLRQVFGEGSELSAASRSYVRGLMESVEADQQWGVSGAAEGNSWALKNGWLPRSTTGLWDVNSIGRVTVGGTDYLVAVLSKGTRTQAQGIALVEAAARAAVSAFTGE